MPRLPSVWRACVHSPPSDSPCRVPCRTSWCVDSVVCWAFLGVAVARTQSLSGTRGRWQSNMPPRPQRHPHEAFCTAYPRALLRRQKNRSPARGRSTTPPRNGRAGSKPQVLPMGAAASQQMEQLVVKLGDMVKLRTDLAVRAHLLSPPLPPPRARTQVTHSTMCYLCTMHAYISSYTMS